MKPEKIASYIFNTEQDELFYMSHHPQAVLPDWKREARTRFSHVFDGNRYYFYQHWPEFFENPDDPSNLPHFKDYRAIPSTSQMVMDRVLHETTIDFLAPKFISYAFSPGIGNIRTLIPLNF